jgi:PTS system mannitol-specific IIC component
MSPKGAYLPNLLGIAAGCVVTFFLSILILKVFGRKDVGYEAAQARNRVNKEVLSFTPRKDAKGSRVGKDAKGSRKGVDSEFEAGSLDIKKIVFACDAGMGSSALGAAKLRKKLKEAGISDIAVVHLPVSDIPGDADVIVCHRELGERARKANPHARFVLITNFLSAPEYDSLVNNLKKR